MRHMISLYPGILARVVEGSGPTVLWIHGYTVDSSIWEPFWDPLHAWSHIALDLPGHGRSDPLGDESLRDLGAGLANAAIDRGVRHVVGLSLGSILALEIVLARPRSFASLTLGAPAYGGGPSVDAAARRYKELQAMYAALGAGPWMTYLWMKFPPDLFRYAADHPKLWGRLQELIGHHSWKELATQRGLEHITREDQEIRRAEASPTPVLLLVGEHEMSAFKQSARHLKARFPYSSIAHLDGVGHLCMLEDVECSIAHLKAHWTAAEQGITVR